MKAIAHIKLLMALLLLSCSCVAQNLVPNYSFEDNPTCGAGITNAPPWFNPTGGTGGTPDCWIACSAFPFKSVPSNWFGYQPARTGIAYTGINSGGIGTLFDQREYIEVPLDSALLAGKKYCVRFYVNLGDSSGYATDGMGAYLSLDSVISNNSLNLPYSPQINNPGGNILTDKVNWVLISGEYIALGGEKYITIGNFKDDANSQTQQVSPGGPWLQWCYYFIEDVYVGVCDTVMPATIYSVTVPNIFTPNNDGINDVFKIATKNITRLNCKIYNRWGILVSELTKINEAWDGLTTSGLQCENGVYYYVVTARGEDGKDYDEKGFLQLIR